jgi:putative spermidine/putrescine transport system substrate-binding protein
MRFNPPDFRISRRSLLRYSAATLAACELTGLPAARAETSFTVGTSGGTWGDGIRKSFIEAPGLEAKAKVHASYLNAPTSVLISRLLAQPSNPPFTVADLLDIEHFLAADSHAIQDYDLDIVTNFKDIFPTARQAPRAGLSHWCASMTLPLISVTYNTKLAAKPQSWKDLWLDKFKGKVGIPDFGWYGQTWLHAINKQLGGTEDDISPGIAAIADLMKKNGAALIKNQEQAIKAFTDEQIVVMPYWNGRAFSLQASGVPVDMSYVPGTIQLHNGFVIAKATSFKEVANRFVNNTLDGTLQLEMVRLFRYPPANRTVKLPPDLAHYAPGEAALEKVVPLDWEKINKGRVTALERWNKEVLG